MDPFPFLKLPLLAQKVVINHICLVTAIELSMVSKKFERVLKQTKITVERIQYSFADDSFSLFIDTPSTGCLTIKPSFTDSDTTNIWSIGGSNLDIVEEAKTSHYSKFIVKSEKDTDESKLESLEKITGHVLKFLKVKNFELYIKTRIDVLNLFIWKYTKRFDVIELNKNYIDSVVVTPDEIKLVLETLTIDYLYLRIQMDNDFDCKYLSANRRLSTIREIYIVTSDWLEHDSLLNMAQETIQCQISEGFSRKVNEILKRWISGENEKLENLRLWTSELQEKCDQKHILMSNNAMLTVFKIDEIKKRCRLPSSGIIMDIRRKHDGCQATVVINECRIDLLVWNKKHLKAIGRM